MRLTRLTVALDAADVAAESAFWADLLDGRVVRTDDDWHTVRAEGAPDIAVQLAPDHVPPQWPDGAQRQQVHLDLDVEDIRTADGEALAKGARLLQATYGLDAPEGFRVYADPAGHPFCLCWG